MLELEGRGAGLELEGCTGITGTDELEEGCSELVAMGITLSEVRVSQGVEEGELEATGATLDGVATTGVVLELEGFTGITGTEELEEGCSELVAMGITLSEVRVSQGVEEGELEATGATLDGVATTGVVLELEGFTGITGTEELEEGCSELVATGTTLSEVRVSQGVEEAEPEATGATLEGVGITLTEPAGLLLEETAMLLLLLLEGRGAGPVGT